MLMRRLLVSTMICSGLMLAAPVSGNAAMGSKVFEPASSWAVSKVDGKGQGKGYCALARRFNDGMILTFARNGNDETSLALDFQKNFLKTDNTYYVTLKPGLGEDRMFEVRPVSGKAMVIRLGQDYAFHDAMGQSGSLTVDISGEPYEFQIADISKGQTEMNGCLASLVQPAAGGRMAADEAEPAAVSTTPDSDIAAGPIVNNRVDDEAYVPPTKVIAPQEPVAAMARADEAPAVSRASEGLTASSGAQSEMQNLREENMRLRNALSRERRNYEDRFQQQDDSSSTMTELREKMRLLEIENGELRQRLTSSTTQQSTTADAPAPVCAPSTDTAGLSTEMKQELLALRDENARLKMQLADQNGRIATLEQAAANAAISAEANVRADNGAAMAEMQGRVAQLEEENAILRAKVKNNHVDAEPGRGAITLAQLRSVEAQLSSVEAERDRLAQQIETMAGKRGDALIDISGDNWSLEEATRRYNEAEREVRRLGGQLEQERTRCAAQKKEIEYMLFDPKVATQEQIARLTTLEEKVMQADSQLEVKTAGYKSRIESLEDSLEQKESSFAETQQRLSSLQNALGEKDGIIRESQKQIAALEKDLANNTMNSAEVQQKMAALTQQVTAKDQQIESAQAQLAEMTQKFAGLQQEAVKTESQLQLANEKLAQARTMADELQGRMDQQIAANRAQEATMEQAQAKIAALNESQAELARAKQQVASLSTQTQELEQAQRQIVELQKQSVALDRARQQIAALSAQKDSLEAAQAKIAALNTHNKTLQEQNQTLQSAQVAQTRTVEREAQQEIADMMQEQKRLQQRVAALETDKQELETALSRIQTAAGTPRGPVDGYAAAAPQQQMAQAPQSSLQSTAGRTIPAPGAVSSSAIAAEPLAPRDFAANDMNEVRQMERQEMAQAVSPATPAVQTQPVSLSPAIEQSTGMGQGARTLMQGPDVQRMLQNAGITPQGGVQTENAGPNVVAYSWDTGTLFGSAEQQTMGSLGQFESLVEAYINKTGGRCGGEFGAVPGAMESRGDMRIASYEIACVTPDGVGASAALVFMARDGLFTAVAHETGMDSMDVAMDVRDAVYNALMQTRLASR